MNIKKKICVLYILQYLLGAIGSLVMICSAMQPGGGLATLCDPPDVKVCIYACVFPVFVSLSSIY